MMASFEERRFERKGRALNVAVGPRNGEPLLLLHGVTRCWQDFEPILPALSTRYQIYAVDLRGHGRSDWWTNGYRVIDYVEDVAELVESDLPGIPILFGHSLGAMVAVGVAAHHPTRVRALVLEDPPFETMGREMEHTPFADFFRGMLAVARHCQLVKGPGAATTSTDSHVRETAQSIAQIVVGAPGKPRVRLGDTRDATAIRFMAWCLERMDPAVLEGVVDGGWLEGYNRDEMFSRVGCPTLLLQGDPAAGGALSENDGKRMQQLMLDCTRIAMPQCGHLLHWLHTDVVLRHVLSFLASVTGA